MNSNREILDKLKMKKASELATYVLEEVSKIIKPGISTLEINDLCHKIIIENNGVPGALNFQGFPKSVCTSINDVICHGIPSEKDILKNGDFVNVDVALRLDNHYGDTSRCFTVGKVDEKVQKLINHTYEAMWAAIQICKSGVAVHQIGKTIENYIKPYGYGIVRDFCGHGIGKKMHEDPEVPAFFDKNNRVILETGMCITIEPMINRGNPRVRVLPDGWTAKTIDGSMSAQWEHTIYITDKGCEVLSFNSMDMVSKKSPIIIH